MWSYLTQLFLQILTANGTDIPSNTNDKRNTYVVIPYTDIPSNTFQVNVSKKQSYTIMTRGGFRGGVRGVRPPKIRKAYVIQR